MDDLAKNINDFLSSPDAMAQIQGVLNMLGGGPAPAQQPQPAPQQAAPPQPASSPPGSDGLASLLGGLSGADMGKLSSLLGAMQPGGDDPKVNLLMALKPYLNSRRSAKLDTAIRLLQLAKLSPMLKQML